MNLKPALYIVGAIIIAGIFFGGRFNLAPEPTPQQPAPATTTDTTPPPTTPIVAAPPIVASSPTTPAPSTTPGEGRHHDAETPAPTPSYDGEEDPNWEIPEQTRHGAISASEAFITGWLTPEPQARIKLLEQVAAQGLLDDLAIANLRTWNATPAGAPTIVELAAFDAMLRQKFTDGRSVDLLLAAEPDKNYGWIITDIQPSQ